MKYLVLIITMIGLALSCSDGTQERTKGIGANPKSNPASDSAGGEDTTEEDEETVDATVPTQVAGAYLTSEFVTALADKTLSEISIGGRVEKDKAPVDLSGITITTVVINTATGATIKNLEVDLTAVEIQYQFNLNSSIVAEASIKMEIADVEGKTTVLMRNLKDMSGVLLTSLLPNQVYDFSNLTKPSGTLKAGSYCDAAGPMTSVKKSVSGTVTTVASMAPGTEIILDKTQHCFRKITDYAGSEETSLLAAKEKIGTYVGSGQVNGGTFPCLFVVFDELVGAGTGKPKLFVLQRTDDKFEANLRKTANDFQCK